MADPQVEARAIQVIKDFGDLYRDVHLELRAVGDEYELILRGKSMDRLDAAQKHIIYGHLHNILLALNAAGLKTGFVLDPL